MSDLPTHEGHGRRGKLNGDEWDAFSRKSRSLLSVFNKPGVAKKTKQQFNRKQRARQKRELNRSLNDE